MIDSVRIATRKTSKNMVQNQNITKNSRKHNKTQQRKKCRKQSTVEKQEKQEKQGHGGPLQSNHQLERTFTSHSTSGTSQLSHFLHLRKKSNQETNVNQSNKANDTFNL